MHKFLSSPSMVGHLVSDGESKQFCDIILINPYIHGLELGHHSQTSPHLAALFIFEVLLSELAHVCVCVHIWIDIYILYHIVYLYMSILLYTCMNTCNRCIYVYTYSCKYCEHTHTKKIHIFGGISYRYMYDYTCICIYGCVMCIECLAMDEQFIPPVNSPRMSGVVHLLMFVKHWSWPHPFVPMRYSTQVQSPSIYKATRFPKQQHSCHVVYSGKDRLVMVGPHQSTRPHCLMRWCKLYSA